jgi:hypothetical protein
VELPEQVKQWEEKGRLGKSLFWVTQESLFFIDRKFRS